MMRHIFFLACITLLFTGFKCKKIDCSGETYQFDAFLSVSPDEQNISVGDTIWLRMREPINMIDYHSGKKINYSGAENFGTAITFWYFNEKERGAAANDFSFVLKKGVNIDPIKKDFVREYIFIEENNFYVFDLGIIPQKAGNFYFAPGNSDNTFTSNNKCDKATISLALKDTDQHINLLEDTNNETNLTEYDRERIYVFQVR